MPEHRENKSGKSEEVRHLRFVPRRPPSVLHENRHKQIHRYNSRPHRVMSLANLKPVKIRINFAWKIYHRWIERPGNAFSGNSLNKYLIEHDKHQELNAKHQHF